MRAAVAFVSIVLSAHVVHASGAVAILIPPAEVDVGMATPVGGAQAVTGPATEILAGIHWASLSWKPTPIDVGVGYVGSFRPVLMGYAASETGVYETKPELSLDGVYFDVAAAVESHRHWRTWLAVRGELLTGNVDQRSFHALGAAVRVATEIYSAQVGGASGGGSGAILAGTFAVGVYVEASHRELAPELGPNAVSAGVSVRVPFMLAAAK